MHSPKEEMKSLEDRLEGLESRVASLEGSVLKNIEEARTAPVLPEDAAWSLSWAYVSGIVRNPVASAELLSAILKKSPGFSPDIAVHPNASEKDLLSLLDDTLDIHAPLIAQNPGITPAVRAAVLERLGILDRPVGSESEYGVLEIQVLRGFSENPSATRGCESKLQEIFESLHFFGPGVLEMYKNHPSFDMLKTLSANWEGTLGSLLESIAALDRERDSQESWELA